MVSHGQVVVNGKTVTIRSLTLKKGDQITLTSRGLKNQIYTNTKTAPRLELPDWLDKNETDASVTITLKDEPNINAIPFPLNEALVISYYSKV